MPRVTLIHKDGREQVIEAQVGYSIMEIATKNNVSGIEGACGGSLACATCHVYVHPDWWDRVLPQNGNGVSPEEADMLDLAFHLKPLSRLGCQIIMRDDLDGLVLALPGATPEWLK
jgi:ferredoxin, 2Fe-2S